MGEADKKLRPTVIGPPGAVLRKRADAAAPEGAAQVVNAGAAAAAPVVRQPTALPGADRQRIDVPPGALERQWPGAAGQVYVQARALIDACVADKATERKAILWGHELQKVHGEIVGEALRLSRSPVLRKVEAYLTRTMDILGSIDLLPACGHGFGGVLGRVFQRTNARIDTPGELVQSQAELEKLVGLMAAALEELLDLNAGLLALAERADALGTQLEAASMAASFLSRNLPPGKEAVAQRFAERALSLGQTVALIREGGATRSLQVDQPLRLISAIQNVALVMLPGFVGSIAAVTALSPTRTTPTEAGELAYRLRDIIEQLQSRWRTP